MATFVASKFDPEQDSDRPVIGQPFEFEDKQYTIGKVSHLLVSDIISGKAEEPTNEEFDVVVVKSHSFRPAVAWVVWGKLKEE